MVRPRRQNFQGLPHPCWFESRCTRLYAVLGSARGCDRSFTLLRMVRRSSCGLGSLAIARSTMSKTESWSSLTHESDDISKPWTSVLVMIHSFSLTIASKDGSSHCTSHPRASYRVEFGFLQGSLAPLSWRTSARRKYFHFAASISLLSCQLNLC